MDELAEAERIFYEDHLDRFEHSVMDEHGWQTKRSVPSSEKAAVFPDVGAVGMHECQAVRSSSSKVLASPDSREPSSEL